MKKRFLSVLLVLALVLSLAPTLGVNAAGKAEKVRIVPVQSEAELNDAIAHAKYAEKILLADNIDLEETVNIPEDRDITLDLGGHVLKGSGSGSVITNFGTLTVEDSCAKAMTRFFADEDGDGCFEAEYPCPADCGENPHVTVTGGVITGGKGTGKTEYSSTPVTFGGAIYSEGTLTLNGGNICGNAANFGGGVCNEGGTFTVNGGTICGNAAIGNGVTYYSITCYNGGGGVCNYSMDSSETPDTFVMNGGTICRNTAPLGGGVYNYSGNAELVVTVAGGEICHNKAADSGYGGGGICNKAGNRELQVTVKGGKITKNSSANLGGGVYNMDGTVCETARTTFTLAGGEITGNTAAYGGGIYNGSEHTTTVYGGKITGNSAVAGERYFSSYGGEGGGVYAGNGSSLILGGTAVIRNNGDSSVFLENGTAIGLGTGENAPKSGMQVGVTIGEPEWWDSTPASNVIAESGADGTALAGFFSDDAEKGVVLKGEALYLIGKTYISQSTGEQGNDGSKDRPVKDFVQALKIADKNGKLGYFVLLDAFDKKAGSLEFGADYGIVLDLNDQVLTLGGNNIVNSGTLTITDTASSKTTRYAADVKDADGSYETLADDASKLPASVKEENALQIQSGIITGHTGLTSAIYNNGTLVLNGGNLVGNCGQQGGAIFNRKTFLMNGGCISGNASGNIGGGVCNSSSTGYPRAEASIESAEAVSESQESLQYPFPAATPTTFTMNGGEISHNTSGDAAGGVANVPGLTGSVLFTMNGGCICSNVSAANGGGVANTGIFGKAEFVLNGGEISGNKAALGGGGVINSACSRGSAFLMNGGRISGNSANFAAGVQNNNGSFIMAGGEISGNTAATNGGGVYAIAGMTLKGAAVIKNNFGGGSAGTADNLAILSGTQITVDNAFTGSVGVSIVKEGVLQDGVVSDACAESVLKYFTSDSESFVLIRSGDGKLALVRRTVWIDKTIEHGKLSVDTVIAVSGETVTVTLMPDSGYELLRLTVTDANGIPVQVRRISDTQFQFTMPVNNPVKISAEYKRIVIDDTYSIDCEKPENGSLKVDRISAEAGQTVTLTVAPYARCTFSSLEAVNVKTGEKLTLTRKNDTTYTFTMPAADVTVKAVFEKIACTQDKDCVYACFTDTDTRAWYHDGLHFCVENGYMNGISATKFDPNGTLSRAMVVTILWRMEGEPAFMNDNIFSDVESGSWYEKAVVWANGKGIVEGYGNGKFGPNDPVTREQLAAILYRYAQYKGYDVSVGENTNILDYDDAIDGISSWAVSAMQWAVGSDIINGIGNKLEARGTATRVQAACMLQRFVR